MKTDASFVVQHQTRGAALLLFALASFGASGCAGNEQEDQEADHAEALDDGFHSAFRPMAEPSEPVVEVSGGEKGGFLARTAQSNAEMFTWSANEFDVPLKPWPSHVCFLTRVSGNLDGNSQIALHTGVNDVQAIYRANGLLGGAVYDGGSMWKLGGAQGHSNSLSSEATCVPVSNFFSDPGAVIWQSAPAYAEVRNCQASRSANLWNGDAVSFLTHVQGNFEGNSEAAEIISGAPNTPSQVRIKQNRPVCNITSWNFAAGARSLFVGIPGTTAMWTSLKYSLVAGSNQSKKAKMIRTRDGVCYLKRISGDFDGGGERIRIFPEIDSSGVEYWNLEAKAQGGSAYTTAECVTYDQRGGCFGPGVPCL
jgi:hypothetical protein